MTIKTRDYLAGQAAAAVSEYVAGTIHKRVFREFEPNDTMYLEFEAPERPMEVARSLHVHFACATDGWLDYDLETSRFYAAAKEGGELWLTEEELVICCYRLLGVGYYLDGCEKRPFNPNIIRVTEVVEALKAQCTSAPIA